MAAINKIYLNWKDYCDFRNWCITQPPLYDKYGKEIHLINMLWNTTRESFVDNDGNYSDNIYRPIMNNSYYVDAYIIRNCPIEAVQKELMLDYGYMSQEYLKEVYEIVKNRKPEIQKQIDDANRGYPDSFHKLPMADTAYWYWNIDDFIIDEKGFISIKNAEKSDYELIKEYKLYTSSSLDDKYERGKHFRMSKIPDFYKGSVCQRPIKGNWMISIKLPDYVDECYMNWHANTKAKFSIGTWDFIAEFVISSDGWSSSCTWCKTIDALKRRMTKWNLPVGTIVRATGRYVGEEYEFIIKK